MNVAFSRWFEKGFPFHTLFENVSGSFLMGVVAGYFVLKAHASQELRLFLGTGILGGYTTFSAFSLETIQLWERGQLGLAGLYAAASVLASIGGLVLGLALVRQLT